jgi:hypothetical protein
MGNRMSAAQDQQATGDDAAGLRATCPGWCVTRHGVHAGEEDWVHTGAPLAVADGVVALLCMSVHPGSGATDGPYVIVGSRQHTLDDAAALGEALLGMVATGRTTSRLSAV